MNSRRRKKVSLERDAISDYVLQSLNRLIGQQRQTKLQSNAAAGTSAAIFIRSYRSVCVVAAQFDKPADLHTLRERARSYCFQLLERGRATGNYRQ